jgi:hypothetical protein
MNKPFDVLVPVEREGKKPLWNKVGVAFEGTKGLTLRLDAIPMGNRLVVIAEELGQVIQKKGYSVVCPVEYERDGEKKTRWTRLGVAVPNKKGMSVLLNAQPLNGKVFINLSEDEE